MKQSYPNPFNSTTTIRFELENADVTRLEIVNSSGQVVGCLVEKWLSPGSYAVPFNALDLSSGVYFYRLRSGTLDEKRKCLFIR